MIEEKKVKESFVTTITMFETIKELEKIKSIEIRELHVIHNKKSGRWDVTIHLLVDSTKINGWKIQ